MSTSFNFPKFVEREIPLYTKLNALIDAIAAKFAAGVGAAELSWPLTAEGNLDMSIYEITGGRIIWGIVNAGNYDTLDDAIAAAGSGGVVFVPPETTITANGAVLAGSGVTVIGAGPSSVLRLTAASTSGWLLATATAAQTGVLVANLTLDGNSATGTGQVGLLLRNDTSAFVSNVHFMNFSGPALRITNDGSDGSGCSQVTISNCTFNGGSATHIYVDDGDEILISNCASNGAGTQGIGIQPGSASAAARIVVSGMTIVSPGTEGIYAQGPGAVFASSPISLWLSNVLVDGTAGGSSDNFRLGDTANVLHHLEMTNCTGIDATRCGMTVCARGGSITGCRIEGATTAGIDLTSSEQVVVTGNHIEGTTIGVDVTAAVECLVTANFVAGTAPVDYAIAGNAVYGNMGAFNGALPGGADVVTTASATFTTLAGGTVCTLNIPAGVLRQGSLVRVTAYGTATTVDDPMEVWLRVGTVAVGKIIIPENVTQQYMLNGYCLVSSNAGDDGLNFGHGVTDANDVMMVTTPTAVTVDCATVVPITVVVTAVGVDMDSLSTVVRAMVVEYQHAQLRTFT